MRNFFTLIYRQRVRLGFACGLLIVTASPLMSRLPPGWPTALAIGSYALGVLGFITIAGTILLSAKIRIPRSVTRVLPPVDGRWLAMNSPASRVPSHGVRVYGQAHAIDLVHDPATEPRPPFGSGRAVRPPSDFPAFGMPVRAMADGVVVAVCDRQRDHRSRSNWLAVIYMMISGALRELGGPRFIVGNHVTVRIDDDVFALVAHLKRGSARVRVGDEVGAGQVLGECGNSGNSSEPHVHAQLMDGPSLWTAQGVPFGFENVRVSSAAGSAQDPPDPEVDAPHPDGSMPRNGEFVEAL